MNLEEIKDRIDSLFCWLFGHRWLYFRGYVVCDRCSTVEQYVGNWRGRNKKYGNKRKDVG